MDWYVWIAGIIWFKSICKVYTKEKYTSTWFAFQDKEEMINEIKNMLEHDIPVVMTIGMSNSGKLKLYRKLNNEYDYRREGTSLHFVTITGLYIDKTRVNHKTMLEVS